MANDTADPTVPVGTLARLFNLTDVRVHQLANMGVVIKTERGRYDLWRSIKGYITYLQERKTVPGPEAGNGEDPTIAGEKLRRAKADADMAEMERDERRGDLQESAAVVRVYAGMVSAAKSKLLALPTRLAPRLAEMKDETAIEAIIKGEVLEALRELGTPAQSVGNEQAAGIEPGADPGGHGAGGGTVPDVDPAHVDAAAGLDGQPVG